MSWFRQLFLHRRTAAATGSGDGTVTSVNQALNKDDTETLSGGPVTTSGTLTRTAVDAAADKIVFWDDSADKKTYLTIGTGLEIVGTTLNATSGDGSVVSVDHSLTNDDTETLTGGPVTTTGSLDRTAVDAGADKLVGWDDSAGKKIYFTLGTGLSTSGTTLNASGGSGTVTSVDQSLAKDDTETLSGGPVTSSGILVRTAVDAGADKLVGWDDSADKKIYFTIGSGLTTSGTTLSATATGITEFRFTADPDTGFDNVVANNIDVTVGGTSTFRFISTGSILAGMPKGSGVSNGVDAEFRGGTAGTGQGGVDGKAILRGASSTGNTGGAAEVRGGDGSTGAGGSTTGGVVTIQAGTSAGSQGGVDVNITGGTAGSTGTIAGAVNITGGTPIAGAGANVNISGSAGVGTNKNGGSVKFTAGAPTGTGQGGYVNLQGSGSERATTDTYGWPLTASINGTPTGTPGGLPTGALPFVIDRSNNLWYFYSSGAWRAAYVIGTNLTISANTYQSFTSSLSDGQFSGEVKTGVLGETVAFGNPLYRKSDDKWYKADADDITTAEPWITVALAAGNNNDTINLLVRGYVRANSLYPTFTIGMPIYLSTTAGEVTQTKPSGVDDVTRHLGFAEGADTMYFNPDNFYMTHI